MRLPAVSNLILGMLVVLMGQQASTQSADPAPLANPKFLRDYAETRGFSLGRPTKAVATPDGGAVLFLRASPRKPSLELYQFDIASGTARLLLTPADVLKGADEELSPEEKARRERMRVSLSGFTDFQLSKDGSLVLLNLSGNLILLTRNTGEVRELPIQGGAPTDAKFSPDGRMVAYVLDHDVRALDIAKGAERRITTGGTERISHGMAEFVAQEEMNRFSGYWWSPDSRFIAYQETDVSDVEVWHVLDPAHPEQAPYASHYPRPGKTNAKVRLGVVSVEGGSTIWIQWDRERYPYLTSVRWDQEGPLTITVQTRNQRELILLKVDPLTGRTQELLTERDAAWVNVRQDVPRWLAGDRGFLWVSEQDGDWRLERRRPDGALAQVLVPSSFGFVELVDVHPKTGVITFTGRPVATQRRLYRVGIDGGGPTELSPEGTWEDAEMNETHSVYVSSASRLDSMPRSTVHGSNGELLGELPSVAEPPPFQPNVRLINVGDPPGFHAALVYPRDRNPALRYPVILSVYGGPLPHTASGVVTESMGSWLLRQWIADQGFIVVCADGRGTPGRGHDWERAISRHLGSVPLEDLVKALKGLGDQFPELDLDRVGVFGWSFGGYLSALAVMKEPSVFKAAVAGAPPADWADYDTHYTERYLGTPEADPEAYREASLLTWAPRLKRPLLLVHGTGDDNVYFRHTLRLADALFRAGRPFEVLPLSGLTHMVPDPVVNEQLYSRIVRHFKAELGEPAEGARLPGGEEHQGNPAP